MFKTSWSTINSSQTHYLPIIYELAVQDLAFLQLLNSLFTVAYIYDTLKAQYIHYGTRSAGMYWVVSKLNWRMPYHAFQDLFLSTNFCCSRGGHYHRRCSHSCDRGQKNFDHRFCCLTAWPHRKRGLTAHTDYTVKYACAKRKQLGTSPSLPG